jgi:hypothetical protein
LVVAYTSFPLLNAKKVSLDLTFKPWLNTGSRNDCKHFKENLLTLIIFSNSACVCVCGVAGGLYKMFFFGMMMHLKQHTCQCELVNVTSLSQNRFPGYDERIWAGISVYPRITCGCEVMTLILQGNLGHLWELNSFGEQGKGEMTIMYLSTQLRRRVCQLKYVKPISQVMLKKQTSNIDKSMEITHLDKWLCRLGKMQEVCCTAEEWGLRLDPLLI